MTLPFNFFFFYKSLCGCAFMENLLLQFHEYLDLHTIPVKPNYYNSAAHKYLYSVEK